MQENNIQIEELDLDLDKLREELKKVSTPSIEDLITEFEIVTEPLRINKIKELEESIKEEEKKIEERRRNAPSTINVVNHKGISKIRVFLNKEKQIKTNTKITGQVGGYKFNTNSKNFCYLKVCDEDGDDILLNSCMKVRKTVISNNKLGYSVNSILNFITDCEEELIFTLYIINAD